MRSPEVQIAVRGQVGASQKRYAVQKVTKVVSRSPSPVIFARVKLNMDANPSVERPATAEAALELDGEFVRAHASAGMMDEAIDILERRLRRELMDRERRRAMHQRLRKPGWQHGQAD
jgi:ribosome-associated translation inhibitor RaiA